MAAKLKRQSMTEALGRSGEVAAFLQEGDPGARKQEKSQSPEAVASIESSNEKRIAVTLRLPRNLAHALIDASAERRKNRAKIWSQQDIVVEALSEWFWPKN